MKAEVLKMLRESGGYISGQQICEKFGVSRTAVWKVIRRLQEEGYQVEAVRNKGYRIVDSPDVMTEEELKSLMRTRWAGRNIVYYKETDSTNLRIKQLGDEGAPEGTLAVADSQSAGRGRRGRTWDSPAGSSIYMSVLLRPRILPDRAPMLTLVMACSVAEGIMDCEDVKVQIKWPNDIIINGRKLVGILTEMSTQIDYINHVTVGVGINVNMTEFPEEIRGTATSLRLETGHVVKRARLIAAIMERLEQNYGIFLQTEDMSGLMEKYSSLLVNQGKEVMVLGAKEEYKAYAVGINNTGELIVRREDGTEEAVYAGEVSVRGVYGYV
ncbi:biotin--[acetyl-CoA-carboxylase] ligase [Lachnoclostridium sp. An169]|uniref:biotin--[acetyl-CoA-carboxylase] ligase n=1 Tax=Lachnoclostridium sp. An169 TaxID=1965569 RepID=UPI000B398E63|nr:biotin--[acetyl-CoA-carboxylase] ligase [Lachnoclostridium sp. An169]OUP84630.1 biotin--[acetyl-CoA-carboxylase] ligase [Lachnoclostridium sp. An169]HJA66140.1 biotin--[acetyl-CoA-carboxylase] ligase [Candidatus Mediterraneibacter cottocaccae]